MQADIVEEEDYKSLSDSIKESLLTKQQQNGGLDLQLLDAEFVRFKDQMLKQDMVKHENQLNEKY